MFRLPLVALVLAGALFGARPAHAVSLTAHPLQLEKSNGQARHQCLQTFERPADALHRLVPTTCTQVGGLQMFQFQPMTGGGYRIVNMHTGHCLDVEGAATHAGARVFDWPCHNGANQRWEVEQARHRVKIRGWQSKFCLDFANGIAVQANCDGWGEAAFHKGPVWHVSRQRGPEGHVGLRSERSGRCLGGDMVARLLQCQGQERDELHFSGRDSAAMTFQISDRTRTCLDGEGTRPRYTTCNGDRQEQLWLARQAPFTRHTVPSGAAANRWQIQNVRTGQCLSGMGDVSRRLTYVTCGSADAVWSFIDT